MRERCRRRTWGLRLLDWVVFKQPSWLTSFCFHAILLIVLGLALQSERMAGLHVPDETLKGISQFLDSVRCDDYGATYGYMNNQG